MTYEEVIELHRKLTQLDTKLDRLIELQADMHKLEDRLRDIELKQSASSGGQHVALWVTNTMLAIGLIIVGWLAYIK